jgi:hypothetical protein
MHRTGRSLSAAQRERFDREWAWFAHVEAVRPGSVESTFDSDEQRAYFAAMVGRVRIQLARRSSELPCVYGPEGPKKDELSPGESVTLSLPLRRASERRPRSRTSKRRTSGPRSGQDPGDEGGEPEPGEPAGRPLLLIADPRWGRCNAKMLALLRRVRR